MIQGTGVSVSTAAFSLVLALLFQPLMQLPPIGIAVQVRGNQWCVAIRDSLAPRLAAGNRVTLAFPAPEHVSHIAGSITRRRSAPCPAPVAQNRWQSYTAYDLRSDPPSAEQNLWGVALAVAGDFAWVRGADGRIRVDLDGDGRQEEAVRCFAGEGEHLTLWSIAADGTQQRRWHEYYDWGAAVDPTCLAGEAGELYEAPVPHGSRR